jgi:transcriptional regulator with GAF, ATPase, and Fis domain
LLRFEKHVIEQALTRSNGVKKHAAELLGIHPKNLSHLLRKHGISAIIGCFTDAAWWGSICQ